MDSSLSTFDARIKNRVGTCTAIRHTFAYTVCTCAMVKWYMVPTYHGRRSRDQRRNCNARAPEQPGRACSSLLREVACRMVHVCRPWDCNLNRVVGQRGVHRSVQLQCGFRASHSSDGGLGRVCQYTRTREPVKPDMQGCRMKELKRLLVASCA